MTQKPIRRTQPPSPRLIRRVSRKLKGTYSVTWLGNQRDPLDELVYIILSGKTREAAYQRTFAELLAEFPTWDDAEAAGATAIERVIRRGGLAKKKSTAISNLLTAIRARVGTVDLRFLSDMPDDKVLGWLCQLPGVGPKTARCVMSYSLGRSAFAVDTHISRIVRRLGWSNHHRLTDKVQDRLEAMIPREERLSLHVNLVLHGRTICTRRHPKCKECVLADLCPSCSITGTSEACAEGADS